MACRDEPQPPPTPLLLAPRRRELDMNTEIRGGGILPDVTSVLTFIAPPGGGAIPPCCGGCLCPPCLATSCCCCDTAGTQPPMGVVTQKLWLFSNPSCWDDDGGGGLGFIDTDAADDRRYQQSEHSTWTKKRVGTQTKV